jgi:subtilase family serine protease
MLMGAMLLALLCLPVGQASAAKPGGKRKLPYSLTPSRTTPYTPCPPGGRMIECNMVIDPPAVKTPAGFEVPGVGLFEGGGPFGGYDPVDLRSAYGVPANGGVGQTVALIDAYGYANAEAELATYREFFGMEACTKANGCFKKVNEKGEEKNYPAEGGELEKSWQEETALDLDMVSAACPQCHILLVEATTQEAKDTGASASEAATLKATEISNSYGYPENNETFCPSKKGCKEYLADYNHSGIPVTVSSGDSGYDDGEVGAPSWPATSPTGGPPYDGP